MAIKLQPSTLVEPFEYISLTDDALDGAHPEFTEEFKRYREGAIKDPPLKDGVEPTRWSLQPIADTELLGKLDGIRERDGKKSWFRTVACLGIVGVTGAPKEFGKVLRVRDEEGYPYLSKRQQNLLGLDLLAELGTAILTHKLPNLD